MPYTLLLGTAQDAGRPQTGCRGACCEEAWANPAARRLPVALGVVDPVARKRWLLEATPAIGEQLHLLASTEPMPQLLDGLFCTHAHLGHYTGLLELGREGAAVRDLPVWAPPGLAAMIGTSLPWCHLVEQGAIVLSALEAGERVALGARITLEAIGVPHRREISETLAFLVSGPERRVLFLPDIDDWEPWDRDLAEVVRSVDVAYLDGTFWRDGELDRDMSMIPHPRIVDTMARLADLPASERAKVRFIHLNHTNPAFDVDSAEAEALRRGGFSIGVRGERVAL